MTSAALVDPKEHLRKGAQGRGRLQLAAPIRFDARERLLQRRGRLYPARSKFFNLTSLPIGKPVARARPPFPGLELDVRSRTATYRRPQHYESDDPPACLPQQHDLVQNGALDTLTKV